MRLLERFLHAGIDALAAGVKIYNGIQMLVSREVDPFDTCVMSVTCMQAGETVAANADKCEVPLVMVVKFEGNVAAVEMAVEAGKAEAEKRGMFIASRIIPRQDEQIEWLARLNALGKSSTI